MAKPQVHVRMYRRLLGDCFLITVGDPKAKREERSHILIDCGVLQQTPGEVKLMKAVAADIRKVVGDYLDLLVITHEHWDHISGFAHARSELIDQLNIKELWLAWTERRGDAQADALRPKAQLAKAVIEAASTVAGGQNATASLKDFNGPQKKSRKLSSIEIIPALIERASKTGKVEYLEPGTVRTTPGPIGLRANVLAPPREPKRLFQALPTPNAKETYLIGNFATAVATRYALADSLSVAFDPANSGPFGWGYRRTVSDVKRRADPEARWLREKYFGSASHWRKVDNDWLDAAGALALKLDNDTNNTSVVLAIELEQGGDVMLFAADAQVGNWLSWHEKTYPDPALPGAVAGQAAVSAKELLGRTILYKVGHHASHNATLEALGLELMTHSGFMAMIPVVEAEARRVTAAGRAVHRGWDMPYPDLYSRLLAKTGGRLLRGDADKGKDPTGSTICTDQKFLKRVSSNAIFHELKVQ